MNKNFIRTTDLETRDKLLKLGFIEVSNSSNVFIFLNDISADKQHFENMNITYTNKLFV